MHQLYEMNRRGCHRQHCGSCGGSLLELLGDILDNYLTIDEHNTRLTLFLEGYALQHLRELMHTVLTVTERHKVLTDPDERNP